MGPVNTHSSDERGPLGYERERDHAVAADLEAGSLVEIAVPGLVIERRLRAVWPKRADPPRLATSLLAQLPDLG